jgi:hypothetical protein
MSFQSYTVHGGGAVLFDLPTVNGPKSYLLKVQNTAEADELAGFLESVKP